tara:strand:+ start:30 stop:917 length:888 start_codon:yes stop_codon:yes gene_type:complete
MSFKEAWKSKEAAHPSPHYVRNIVMVDANEFYDQVMNATESEAFELVESIYNGDAYILKNAFDEDFIDGLKERIFSWSKKVENKSFEMRDGCPDYHCVYDKPQGPVGGYTSLEHSYVFFRHNKNPLNVFLPLEKYWQAIKVLSGHDKDAYKDNIPSDGLIDRLTFLQYPINQGKITKHFDSPNSQKLLLGLLMSQIGEDYDYGKNGFYLVDGNQRKLYIENICRKGDFVCVYPTLYHGVPKISKVGKDSNQDWDSIEGRWYLQCYTAESHEVEGRSYSIAVRDDEGHGPVANHIK